MNTLVTPQNIIVDMPPGTQAHSSVRPDGTRHVYFEATRDGTVDREGEMVAADALWNSRDLMLEQGDFDISHWAHLPNPMTGRPQPEYRIGHPTQVTRQGRSIFVGGEIYRSQSDMPPAKDGSPWWADYFWHSLYEQNPPAKWFPSVYGRIPAGGVEMVTVNGQQVRRITKAAWFSVGFALRAQHPELGPVSLTPVGNLMAKADAGDLRRRLSGDPHTMHLSWQGFAKAVQAVGVPVTDHALKRGVQALTPESLEKKRRGTVAKGGDEQALRLRVMALKAMQRGDLNADKRSVSAFFQRRGVGAGEAGTLAAALLRDLQNHEA